MNMESPFTGNKNEGGDIAPVAFIKRKIKLENSKKEQEKINITFPIFKEIPKGDLLINALKKANSNYYGIIGENNKVTVYTRGVWKPIDEVEFMFEKEKKLF